MAVFRVHKNNNFIVIGKTHLKEKDMSLKAIGLLSIMLSLPDDWDYSVGGLAAIRSESKDTINRVLNELEEFGYLKRTQLRSESGLITGYEYDIYEEPYPKNPDTDNPDTDNPDTDYKLQYNNNKLNNNKLNNKEYKKGFKKPTLEEVEAYKKERNLTLDAQSFIDYYESNGWKVGRNSMKDWKATARRWSRSNTPGDTNKPEWLNKEIKIEEVSEAEQKELDELLKDFR